MSKTLTDKTITFEVEPTDTIDSLKAKVYHIENILIRQLIISVDKRLEGNRTISDDKIQNESTIHVAMFTT